MLQKLYAGGEDGRYSPAECIGCRKVKVNGSPDPKHISTSFYDFARVHQTIRVTPAMEAGVSDHVWSIAEIVALLDAK